MSRITTCSVKNAFLEISQNSQKNAYARVSFLKKVTLAQVFSCEFCEIFKNIFFYRTPRVAVSVNALERLKTFLKLFF